MSIQSSINMAVWLGLLIYIIYNSSKYLWKEHAKLIITHGVFMAFLMILHDGTFRTLGWAIRNFLQIKTFFYVPSGIYPPWLTLTTWILSLVAGVVALVLALMVAGRKDKYRIWLLRAIPFLLICDILRYYNQVTKGVNVESKKIYTSILISLVAVGVPYLAMYLFYTKEFVLSILFDARVGDKGTYKYTQQPAKSLKAKGQSRKRKR